MHCIFLIYRDHEVLIEIKSWKGNFVIHSKKSLEFLHTSVFHNIFFCISFPLCQSVLVEFLL